MLKIATPPAERRPLTVRQYEILITALTEFQEAVGDKHVFLNGTPTPVKPAEVDDLSHIIATLEEQLVGQQQE